MVTCVNRPDTDTPLVAVDRDDVGAVGAVHDDVVWPTIAGAGRSAKIEVYLGDGRSSQVVDGNVVDAALGVNVEPLDTGELECDRIGVARQGRGLAVGGECNGVATGRALEAQ
jgi:hypothetical protein